MCPGMGPRDAVPTSFPGRTLDTHTLTVVPPGLEAASSPVGPKTEDRRAGEPGEPGVRGEGTRETMKCPWLLHRGGDKATPARLAVTKPLESIGRWDRRPTLLACVTASGTVRCDTGPVPWALGA